MQIQRPSGSKADRIREMTSCTGSFAAACIRLQLRRPTAPDGSALGDVELRADRNGSRLAELARGPNRDFALQIEQADAVAPCGHPAGDRHPIPDTAPVTAATRSILLSPSTCLALECEPVTSLVATWFST